MNDMDLDRLLAEARGAAAAPSADFMARLLQDALNAQPRSATFNTVAAHTVAAQTGSVHAGLAARPVSFARTALRRRASVAVSLWARFSAGLGGAGVLGGLATIALTGVWLGYADPSGLTESFVTYADAGLEMVPVDELFLTEG